MDDWWFESQQGLGIFLFTTTSRLVLCPTKPPIQWIQGALSLQQSSRGMKLTDHPSLCSVEVKNSWRYTSTPQYAFMAWCSVKAQGQLHYSPLNK
jgi:hypothetical protein